MQTLSNYDNPLGSIHSVSSPCLGDVWSSLNFFYHLSIKSDRTVYISEFVGDLNQNVKNKIVECLEVLSDPGWLEIVPQRANRQKLPYYFGNDYFRTLWVWKKRPHSKLICYQFDAMTGDKAQRRPTKDEIEEFTKRAIDAGWRLENLGGERPLKECVKLASVSYAFIGAVSGLAEVCTSVGVPMHIVVNDFPLGWVRSMYAGRMGRLYGRLPEVDLSRLHEIRMI